MPGHPLLSYAKSVACFHLLLALFLSSTSVAKPLWPPSWIWAKEHNLVSSATYGHPISRSGGHYNYAPQTFMQPKPQEQLILQLQPSTTRYEVQLQQKDELPAEEQFNLMQEQIMKKKADLQQQRRLNRELELQQESQLMQQKQQKQLQLQQQQQHHEQGAVLEPGEQIYEMFTPGITEIIPKPLRLIQNYGKLTAKQRMHLQKAMGDHAFQEGNDDNMRKSLVEAVQTAISRQFLSPGYEGHKRELRSNDELMRLQKLTPLSLMASGGLANFLRAATGSLKTNKSKAAKIKKKNNSSATYNDKKPNEKDKILVIIDDTKDFGQG